MADTFTIHQLSEVADLSRMQAEQWITRGYFQPENEELDARTRRFTFKDAVRLSVLAALARHGLKPAAASAHTHSLYAFKDDEALLVIIEGPLEIKLANSKTITSYTPDEPRVQSKIIRRKDLDKLIGNAAVDALTVVNLDNIEKRIKAALAAID